MDIRLALSADLESLVPLFDAYRVFYRVPSDPERARRFLASRLAAGDSRILLAFQGKEAIGFAQLYPSFSSVSMQRLWILNDLFVAPEARRMGTGKSLMAVAEAYARAEGAKGLQLATQADNRAAQGLYAQMGYRKDEEFFHYNLIF